MTLNGVIALFCFVSANSGIFRAHCVKVHVRYLIYWWVLVEACRYTIERSVHASNAPTRPRKLPLRVRVLTNGRAVQNGWTDRDAAQTADSYGLKEQCISWMSILAPSGEYDWTFSCTIQKATARTGRLRPLVMVALWNRADHYIFILSFVLSFFFFFPRLISAVADWMSAILPHMVWP